MFCFALAKKLCNARYELSMITQTACVISGFVIGGVIQSSYKLTSNVPFRLSVALTALITPLLSYAFITPEIYTHATLRTLAHCSQPAHLM